jgi:four helix bundle protein
MFRFEGLEVWRLSVEYAKDCYAIARKFPQYEQFALADQLRRASISISNNIAEGSIGSSANFRKYIGTAIGSALETVNILNFAYEIGYISKQVQRGKV